MPVMSPSERGFWDGAVWHFSGAVTAHELHTQQRGRDVLEIGAGSGSVAAQLLLRKRELALTAINIGPHMTRTAAAHLRGFPNAFRGFSAT